MTRISKKAEHRSRCPKKHRPPSIKTGSKKDKLELGYKEHFNAITSEENQIAFIPRIKSRIAS